jgi:hypothetical protein
MERVALKSSCVPNKISFVALRWDYILSLNTKQIQILNWQIISSIYGAVYQYNNKRQHKFILHITLSCYYGNFFG